MGDSHQDIVGQACQPSYREWTHGWQPAAGPRPTRGHQSQPRRMANVQDGGRRLPGRPQPVERLRCSFLPLKGQGVFLDLALST